MMDLPAEEGWTNRLLDLLIAGYAERIEGLAPLMGEVTDVVLINDDLGLEDRPMLSVDL